MAENWHIGQEIVCVDVDLICGCGNRYLNKLEIYKIYRIRGIIHTVSGLGFYLDEIKIRDGGEDMSFNNRRFRPIEKKTSISIFEAFLKDPNKELAYASDKA